MMRSKETILVSSAIPLGVVAKEQLRLYREGGVNWVYDLQWLTTELFPVKFSYQERGEVYS